MATHQVRVKLTIEDLVAALHPPGQAARVPMRGADAADRPGGDLRPAAVLVPLEQRDGAWRALLTLRTARLSLHAGQVSFPGGQWAPGDKDLVATALRETTEETAIGPGYVQVAGLLDGYCTITGYLVTPVVGVLHPGYRLEPAPAEVSELFWMPLARALQRKYYRRETVAYAGKQRTYYTQTYAGHEVWGATAAILLDLGERLA